LHHENDKNKKKMDKHLNVRVIGVPKSASYDKKWMDTISDKEMSELALSDGDTTIFESMEEFSEVVLNNPNAKEQLLSNWWYFLTDMA
jgi:predicted transcriptional regulator